MKIVLDANIYISSLISTLGNPRQIIEHWDQGNFEVLITQDILDEVGRILRYPRIVKRHKKDERKIRRYLKLLSAQTTVVKRVEKLNVVTDDESDNRYIECAVAGRADYIISGDNHLLEIGEYQGIIIFSPAAFTRLLRINP
ncbi:hypothetical protein MNBD_CHLOROFLEXI01-57 [hydrothermal vent metagenome]|uniref:PIN domain-containing protein n=1 Tax=hydrothermal vent metagenome TaxID=652676 RepID=A0A3B0VFZ0_9ZZZZ